MSKNRTQTLEVQVDNSNPLNLPLAPVYKASPVISTAVSESGAWITDGAWICGLAGAVAVLLCAWWFNATGALEGGLYIFGYQLTGSRQDTLLAGLSMIAGVMLLVEFLRLWRWEGSRFFNIDPDLAQKRVVHFLGKASINYFLNLALLFFVIKFFHTAGEYGFSSHSAYYQPWFRFLEQVWYYYGPGLLTEGQGIGWFLGFFYVVLTRALKYSPDADRRDMVVLPAKVLGWAGSHLLRAPSLRPSFGDYEKKAARALLVKVFFGPLMTVFFCDQFPHLVSNVGYVFNWVPNAIATNSYTHNQFNNDFFNLSIALIFSIDVALAWVGYVTSSRWVDNQTASAEPTMLGWMVCIICYPPFQMFLGLYYSSPGEREVLQFDSQWLITFFTGLMVLSYIVYMSATLWFGVRFSNLTNRGIIRKGPFAIIRHPAYASKNFSWWIVMFPAIVWNATHTGLEIAFLQTVGLVLMTWVYYLRAMTEERHLSADPAYLEYCKQVPYRFIPGVI
jgi:protein-S-isoprenylcysteine O-methyltransferase Ste14